MQYTIVQYCTFDIFLALPSYQIIHEYLFLSNWLNIFLCFMQMEYGFYPVQRKLKSKHKVKTNFVSENRLYFKLIAHLFEFCFSKYHFSRDK